jgi:hypothetical protein
MKIARYVASLLATFGLSTAIGGAGGCSSSSQGNGSSYEDGGGTSSGYYSASGSGGGSGSASGFSLSQEGGGTPQMADSCPNNGTTSISGRVYDPAMVNPLYNVTVYVPMNSAEMPLPSGPQCGCSSLYPPVLASAVTDAGGNFKITGTSSGTVPLVVQVGKWRMQYMITNVKACEDNAQNDKSLHLPRNHMEGDIPQIAISTGGADSLECLPLRMGVDASEYVGGPGTATSGHLHIFTGYNGATLQGGTAYDPGMWLWDKDTDMQPYDVVLFSCEGAPTAHIDDVPMGRQSILDYANNGGRVFASHYHYAILNGGPFAALSPPLATWDVTNSTGGTALNADNDPMYGKIVQTLNNSTKPFPEGVALNTWLGNVGALSSNGELEIHYSRDNAQIGAANTGSQPWAIADIDSVSPGTYTQYFSFDTPLTGGDKCGRVVYSDLHVSGGPNSGAADSDYPGFTTGGIVPDGCASHPLSPQETALEFMIFDLSSCLIPIGGASSTPPM